MSYTNTRRRPSSFSGRKRAFSYPTQPKKRSGLVKDYINPSRFIKPAKPVTVEEYTPTNQFADFDIHELIQKNLQAKGITTPTPIQDKTIEYGLSGRDVVGIANTGTGKTLAFAIPLIQHLLNNQGNRALIMAPTRELAQQIEVECRAIAKNSGLFGALLIGGSPMGKQLSDLKQRPQIVIGTPGRIKDHMERGTIHLAKFNMVVLDEVDRMLDMGFINDMRTILEQMGSPRQSFFYSATMDPKVNALIDSFSNDPITISVKQGDTSDNVDQNIIPVSHKSERIEKLHTLLLHESTQKTLIFDDTQRDVERLSKELEARGFKADAIHGGKTQGQRQRALRRFKANEIDILVATDVAARGIDVTNITHVINYSAPKTYDDYVHRVGRAGRAGRTGTALTFVEDSNSRY